MLDISSLVANFKRSSFEAILLIFSSYLDISSNTSFLKASKSDLATFYDDFNYLPVGIISVRPADFISPKDRSYNYG